MFTNQDKGSDKNGLYKNIHQKHKNKRISKKVNDRHLDATETTNYEEDFS